MSGAVCPACGIGVVSGYVKCPKCHAPLPRSHRSSISPSAVGGTVVEAKPRIWPYVVGVLVIGGAILAWFEVSAAFEDYRNGVHHAGRGDAAIAAAPDEPTAAPTAAPVPFASDQPARVVAPTVNPELVASALKKRLDKQRLWSTIGIIGDHVDVRSASCADKEMKPVVETAVAEFRAAGLVKVRCLEQSGAVVFARDL